MNGFNVFFGLNVFLTEMIMIYNPFQREMGSICYHHPSEILFSFLLLVDFNNKSGFHLFSSIVLYIETPTNNFTWKIITILYEN